MNSKYCEFVSSVSPKAESGSHPGVKMLGTALKYVCSMNGAVGVRCSGAAAGRHLDAAAGC